ncbi:hypothetical protein B0A49_04692 [Cryomyces minteri]|uniref:BTB domain-containing protein n=1 Tax=Cryomyces minteri TaxID=331657 RepID=A0A4U0XKU4_9PEZI|nr:hypothetical protein B0A49_04692 [Cryomyces minteri]
MALPRPPKRIRLAEKEEPIVVKGLPDGFFKQVDFRDPLHFISVPDVRALAQTYAFGCRIWDVGFMDTIMDTLIGKLGTNMSSWDLYVMDLIKNLYPNVPPGSAARRLVVFMIACSWTKEMLETFYTCDTATRYPDILLEIAAASLDTVRVRTTALHKMPQLERFEPTNFTSSPVTIIVGSAPKEVRSFSLHKELLFAKSDYFRAAFMKTWKEGREGEEAEVDLERQELSDDSDEDEVVVDLDDRQLNEYRSAMQIENSAERGGHISEEQEDEIEEKAVEYGDLGEAISRRHTVMDELLSRMRSSGTSWEAQAAILATTLYPYVSANCPARHLIIDIVTDRWTKEYLEQFHDQNPGFRNYDLMYDISAELLGDYTERLAGLPYAYSGESSACAYHEHKRLGLPCHRAEEAS